MVLTPASVRAAVLEQTERTRQCSKVDIQRFIEESELNIISLDSQINALIDLRDSKRASVLALRYIISPIRTLPVELLAEIFDLTVENYTHIDDAHRISQVCSHWRQVAHSTPRLWTRRLAVDLREKDFADELKTWLARSAPLPIPIAFVPVTEAIDPDILEAVLKDAPRFSSLEMVPMDTMPSSLVRRVGQCRLDNLVELNLVGTIEDDDTDTTPLSFIAVPRLRKLRISLESTAPQPIFHWAQLTNLTVNGASPDVTFGILSQCTSLLQAAVVIPGWPPLPEIKHSILVFNQLHTLVLHFMEFIETSEDIASFFDCLSTPLLRDLELVFMPVQWPQTHFTAFQLRAPTITQLKFTYSESLTSDDVVAAIRNSPSLTHLKINYCDECFDDAFIRTLHYEDGVEPLVPHLQDLSFWSDKANFTEDVLAGMIASRWWSDTELASKATPPAVTRWAHVEFDIEDYEWGSHFVDVLKDIPSNVLVY
ncbi:F-box domain-containing protein [Mycena sanguinolenta]|uniref:F-box domain-containing protein n=1 Tax=Mycena sanguinolenta TaxID=230812 RepID=A0A8H6YAS9_9AGAR|nr:F-box domain-containing protein [Mycena sanguinolenta]